MEFNFINETRTGKRHFSLGKANEDVYHVYEDDRIAIAVVSDGASQSPCAIAAATANIEAVIEVAKDPDIWTMKNKHLKLRFMESFEQSLKRQPYNYELLCATCAAVIVNKYSEEYIALSVGDCMIASLNRSFEPELLLSPRNLFFQKNRTVFTNAETSIVLMKICTGKLDNIAAITLITDGAQQLFEIDNTEELTRLAALNVMNNETARSELNKQIEEMSESTSDDLTVVMISISDDQSIMDKAVEICGEEVYTSISAPTMSYEENNQNETEISDETIVEYSKSSIIEFLKTPRTAEELIISGYCHKNEIVTSMFLLIDCGIVEYSNYMFRLRSRGDIYE